MWPDFITQKFEFSVYPITYPEGEDAVNWKKVFKPCATQRLFIPVSYSKLTTLDLIYSLIIIFDLFNH